MGIAIKNDQFLLIRDIIKKSIFQQIQSVIIHLRR